MAWVKTPHCGLAGGQWSQRKEGIPTHSPEHTNSLPSHRQRHTPKAPVITRLGPHTRGPLTCEHPQILSQEGVHLRAQPGHGGWGWGDYKYSKDRGSNCSRLSGVCVFLWGGGLCGAGGGILPSFPLSLAHGALPLPLPWGRELGPNPKARVRGGGREEGARLRQARHKETSFSLGSMATLGRGQSARDSTAPTCRSRGLGGHSPAGLTWAWLTCAGAAGTPRRGAWAPSRFPSARPGGSGRHRRRPRCEGRREGLSRRVLEL